MDGMIGIRGEFLIVLMAENLRGVALVKVPQCFGPTFHTSHGLQARHGHHAIGSCELFRTLFDPFWLQKSGRKKWRKLGPFEDLTSFHAIQKTQQEEAAIINTSHHQPPPLVQKPFHHQFSPHGSSYHQAKLGSGTASSSSKRCRSSSARRSASPSTSASDLLEKHQITKLKLIFQTVWGGEKLCLCYFGWLKFGSLQVLSIFFLDDFKGIFWSNDHFMEFFECLDICRCFCSSFRTSSWAVGKTQFRPEKVWGLGRSFIHLFKGGH